MTICCKILIGLLFVLSTNAQQGGRGPYGVEGRGGSGRGGGEGRGLRQESDSSSSAGLQPWLLGLTAMVVFLFIVFILLIVNRVWCKNRNDTDEEDNKRERVNMNVYDNATLDEEGLEDKLKEYEENKKAAGKWVEEENAEPKVTAM